MTSTIDRRRHERFALPPMYSPVIVDRVSGTQARSLEGHAYDLSESGMRLELDEALDEGELVSVHATLPAGQLPFHASGRVVRVQDAEDDPGPRRAALEFCGFASEADRRRLWSFLGSGFAMRAA